MRPQPKRDGPDDWPTPPCLTSALVAHVLPALPLAPIWEPAAGYGNLVDAMQAAGRTVVATDVATGQDFLRTPPPPGCRSIVTNPPFNFLDKFLARALSLLNTQSNELEAAVLLLRWDDSITSPRWSFCWITWLRGCHGPPTMCWVMRPALHVAEPCSRRPAVQPELPL